MQQIMNEHLQLANRIYELDEDVYRCLGSSLGRVFTGDREACVQDLIALMDERTQAHLLRSEIALIGNMARTIQDPAQRSRVMTEYNDILRQAEKLPASFGAVDIVDEQMASLNTTNLKGRFSAEDHLVICIGRTYGCAGTDIGFQLADALKIDFYDTEIFTEVLDRLEAEKTEVSDHASFAHGQNLNRNLGRYFDPTLTIRKRLELFSRYHGLPRGDAVFFNQSDLICDLAQKKDFIIMGRCADVILTNNHIPHISIFITAPFAQRVRRVMQTDNLNRSKATRLLRQLDRQHGHYYNYYTGRKWGSAINYDLCLNSASYGIDGSVQLIKRMIDQHTPHHHHDTDAEQPAPQEKE